MRRAAPGILVALVAVGIAGVLILASTGTSGSGAAGLVATPDSASPVVSTSPDRDGSPAESGASGAPSAEPSRSPSTSPPASPLAPSPLSNVPIVPVTQFRAAATGTTLTEVRSVLAGTSRRYEALELVAGQADAILAALGADRPTDPALLVLAPDAVTLAQDLAKHRDRLALMRADEVSERVRALALDGAALFGVDRVGSTGDWALTAQLPEALPGVEPFDPAATWTLVAGGDILLDRGVARQVKILGKGVDFPFDGGTADITSRYCCSTFGWQLPRVRRTGNEGAVRHLLTEADLAVANFENPAPNRFRYHVRGTVFSADPALVEGLANVGIDYVSLGNNHIRDAGAVGVSQTRNNLARWGIDFSGAGADVAEAREPALLEVGDVTIAILSYDTIARSYAAGPDRAGSAQLTARAVTADVAAAREADADVVIVYPHWGVEYRATPTAAQRELAHAAIDAGADVVIGNHAHWAGAMEVYRGRPIWYALGNFVFDQTWSEPTMEGITLELTFRGTNLVQIRMRPHLILDAAQPNLLDPAGDGKVVMNRVWSASKRLLNW